MLWVIPCKHDPTKPYVGAMVESIRRHQPDDQIMVVDSCSDDLSYLDDLDVEHVRGGNRHYATGSWRHALEVGADQYALVHDSMLLNAPLPATSPLTTMQWFSARWGSVELTRFGRDLLDRCGVPEPSDWAGIVGPILWCDHAVLAAMADVGVLDTPPATKEQESAMERVVGIVLAHLGHDVKRSLHGEHAGQGTNYDTTYVTKFFPGRL